MLPLLALLVILPFLAIIPIALFPERYSLNIALLTSFIVLALIGYSLFTAAQQGLASLSFTQSYFTQIGANLSLQLTNISLILVVMSGIIFFAASLVGSYFITKDQRLYSIVFMLILGGSLGLFLSGNLFLFYIFWEVSEFSMFFIIFGYGGYDRRYAAIKFIIYSIVASLMLLIAILLLYFYSSPQTFDILSLQSASAAIPQSIQLIILVLLLGAFMIKAPIFPFHNWLPDAHTEAPATGSMVLAGVLLKFGGYGLILTFLLVPIAANYAIYIAAIFGFSAIYGALVAMRQTHLKRMIAYTSIVDMGIISLGIAAINSFGTSGALYGMLAHALAISLLFMLAGVIDKVYGTLMIDKLKGIVESNPKLAWLFLFGILAAIGLPLTSGFIGDILIFVGSYSAFGAIGLVPIGAILLVGTYMFWVIEKSFFNIKVRNATYALISKSIFAASVVLGISTIVLGIAPSFLLALSAL